MTTRPHLLLLAGLLALTAGRAPAQAIGAAQSANATGPSVGSTHGASPARRTSADNEPLEEDYHLGAGDKLRVEVYKDPQLSQSLQIRPDGKITMPLVGDLVASGMTPLELRDRIALALKEFVTNPVVTVIVVETGASNVYVMGEVNRPGTLAYQGPMTALQAIAMSGGFKDFANRKDVRILRRTPKGVETLRFNYREAVKGGEPLYLRAGDTVIVQ